MSAARMALWLGLLSVLVGAAVAAADAAFEPRWNAAEANRHTDAGHDYITGPFQSEFYGKFAEHINECTRTTGERLAGDRLRAVLELGADGKVLDVAVDPASLQAQCFAKLAKQDSFSKPPTDHYLVPVDIRLKQP